MNKKQIFLTALISVIVSFTTHLSMNYFFKPSTDLKNNILQQPQITKVESFPQQNVAVVFWGHVCKTELKSICAKYTDIGQQLSCLFDNEDQVSADCIAGLNYHRFKYKDCEEDIRKLCPNVNYGGGRAKKCLEKQKKQVSAACRVLYKI